MGQYILKIKEKIQFFPSSVNKWINWRTHKQKNLITFLPICEISQWEDVHQFWKRCIEIWAKYPTFPFFSEQMNQLTDTQTKNLNFILANLWYRSRGRCPPILVKIYWKLSKFSNFMSEGLRVSGCDNPRCIARQLAKASGRAKNSVSHI